MTEIVLHRHDPCPWLPSGGVAEVVLSDGPPPDPICVVRLLVVAGAALLVSPRPDGRGLDIPSRVVTDGAESSLDQLQRETPAARSELRPLGFVRNTVSGTPPDDYPWPAPVAHFAVWRVDVDRAVARSGEWLDLSDAARALAERHWWPLVDDVVRSPRTG